MKLFTRTEFRAHLAGLVLALAAGSNGFADDTEIFVGNASLASGVTPNVLFIIDTSGSMNSEVLSQPVYDSRAVYPGACTADRVYWREKAGDPPECDTKKWFNRAALRCAAASQQLDQDGLTTLEYMAQFEVKDKPKDSKWDHIDDGEKDWLVECQADNGTHGNNAGDPQVFVSNGLTGPWSSDPANSLTWGEGDADRQYILYTGNYLNWTQSAATVTRTRLEVVQLVTNNLLENLSGVNVGLMRFSNNSGSGDAAAEGGQVLHAVEPIELGRDTMQDTIDAMRPSGWTPLSETMYEAALYYRGMRVDYGRNARGNSGELLPSVPESRTGSGPDGGDFYLSPVQPGALSCQKNFIVLLTDGEPTRDMGADGKVASLNNPGFAATTGRASCDGSGDGRCLDDVAEYLFRADLNNDAADGIQNVITYTIGFTIDLPILERTATRGGGDYYTANDTKSLEVALTSIVTDILKDNTTFVAPTVPVNTFNRTQTLNELFISVFQADSTPLWPGNLKKYELVGNDIVGADGVTPVVDPNTGYFKDEAQSIWSANADGADVTQGGAAGLLGAPADRKVYSNLGGDVGIDLATAGNLLLDGNAALTTTLLNLGGPGDPSRGEVIAFARGTDLDDEDGDGDTTDSRNFMGDPLHARPATVVYGGVSGTPDSADAVVYMATNEGFLHAIDAKTGQELFAFMPRQLLPKLKTWFDNDPSPFKGYGLDGDIRARTVDQNGNGIIEPAAGDRVVLYFGMRRGGRNYFALEVTNRNAPRLLWAVDESDLPGLGQTWSTPVVARVDVQGATQNDENAVLIFGGGYDPSQDNPGYSTDSSGNGLYIVDADSGALLWRAGSDAAASLQLPAMSNSIPAGVRVLDLNSDDFADRMYVGDMGGQLWRFDIFNGQTAGQLVAGGVMAALGAADLANPDVEDNRRFYNTPDVSLIRRKSDSFLSISIGSGYRAHPLDTDTEDSFYSIRDFNPFRQLNPAEYVLLEGDKVTHDDDRLENITGKAGKAAPSVDSGAMGWRLDMGEGEKVLAQSRTFQNNVFFTSYSPTSNAATNSCVPQRGTNRLYVVSVEEGKPPYNLDGEGSDEALTIEDRSQVLSQSGIAPDVTFLFQLVPEADPEGQDEEGAGDCSTLSGVRPQCLVGLERCAIDFCNAPVRTFWTQDEATETR